MTASSMACTPLFLNAEPPSTGTISLADACACAAPHLISSSVSSTRPRGISPSARRRPRPPQRQQVVDAARRRSACSSAGIGPYSNVVPCVGLVPEIAFIFTRSITPANLSSAADHHLDRHRSGAQPVLDLLDDAQEIGAVARSILFTKMMRGTSYLLAWRHTVSVCGCTPAQPHKHHHGTVEHPQRTLHLDREIDVPGGVDDVQAVLVELLVHALPEAGGRRGGDGDATLLLLRHPVHRGGAVVHLAELVRYAGVEQHALGRGGLACVDVRARCRCCDSA
jgi:hypothetical protein